MLQGLLDERGRRMTLKEKYKEDNGKAPDVLCPYALGYKPNIDSCDTQFCKYCWETTYIESRQLRKKAVQ